MKHLRLFDLEELYHDAKSESVYPTVSYTVDSNKTWFMRKTNYYTIRYNADYLNYETYLRAYASGFNSNQIKEIYVDGILMDSIKGSYQVEYDGQNHEVKVVMQDGWENADSMFNFCRFDELDITTLDTSNVVSAQEMFHSCSVSSGEVDLSKCNWSKLKYVQDMFKGHYGGLYSITLPSSFGVSIDDWSELIGYNSYLDSIDFSKATFKEGTSLAMLFNQYQASFDNLTYINMSCDTSKVGSTYAMFGALEETGEFVYNPATIHPTILEQIPEGWTLVDITAG